MYQKRRNLQLSSLELGGDRYHSWKTQLLLMERYLLRELGFSLYSVMDHPHTYLLYYTKLLNAPQEVSQRAWNYLNDSMRLDISVRFPASEIACAAIYLSARTLQFSLPLHPTPWWQLMTKNFETVEDIAENILELYTFEKLLWLTPLSNHVMLSAAECKKFDVVNLV